MPVNAVCMVQKLHWKQVQGCKLGALGWVIRVSKKLRLDSTTKVIEGRVKVNRIVLYLLSIPG